MDESTPMATYPLARDESFILPASSLSSDPDLHRSTGRQAGGQPTHSQEALHNSRLSSLHTRPAASADLSGSNADLRIIAMSYGWAEEVYKGSGYLLYIYIYISGLISIPL